MNKFSDPVSGDINYSLFIQAVDDQYTGQVMEQPRLHTSRLAQKNKIRIFKIIIFIVQ